MIALVTGAGGFLGRHAVAELRRRGAAVVGLARRPGPESLACDLLDRSATRAALATITPDLILHCAGKTPPADADEYHRVNVLATLNLLHGTMALVKRPRVVLVGSAAEYGLVPPDQLPVREDCPCRPADAYGQSKLTASLVGLGLKRLPVVVGRVFNLVGPDAPDAQALGGLARKLAAAPPGPVRLEVGDLTARRDFLDVRDAVRALIALGEHGTGGRAYNIGSGVSRSVREGLDVLIAASGRAVELVPRGHVAEGPSDSRADVSRLREAVGWQPMLSFEESLRDLWASLTAGPRGPTPPEAPETAWPLR